jgi:hypothetical protein
MKKGVKTGRRENIGIIFILILISSCSSSLVKWSPETLIDSSDVEITCDANEGNKGLMDFPGQVFVHIGLITNKSQNKDDWRFVKFKWGSRESMAKATPAGKNKWKFSIKNIRQYFGVGKEERILNLAILFREGGCFDIYCKTLRNSDGSNIYIPISDQSVHSKDSSVIN